MNGIAALALVVALVGPAMPTTAHENETGVHFSDGNVFIRHDHGHADHEGGEPATFECSNLEASTYVFTGSDYCNTGQHSIGVGFLAMGFAVMQPGLTGMLEHVISHPGGEVRFNCSWASGAFTGCRVVSAVWPSAGADFCHEFWGHAGPPGLDWYVPNTPPCDTTIWGPGVTVTTNAPSGGSGKPVGAWNAYFSHG